MPRSTQVMKFTRKRKSKFDSAVKRKQARIDRTSGEKFTLAKAIKSSGGRNTVIVERSFFAGTMGESDTTTASFVFKLSDLPNYTDFTNLYDQYRFVGVKATIINPCIETRVYNSATGLESTRVPGTLISAVDLNDASAATVNQVLEHESAVIHGCGMKMTRELIPALAQAAYQGAFTGYTARQNQWVDANSPSVEHYGLKLGVRNSGLGDSNATFEIFLTYILEFKLPY